ncbi:MAG: carboxypeptidase-like regulatory domain-containing protein, partial [Acidobacteria bacterium]|nr:carboxypeptidase-like regulatory domain-containing protein [Acidobacteriota bacterium]
MKVLYLIVSALLAGGTCFGQEARATLTGRVTDPTGAVVPGADVRAVNLATNAGGSSVTNQSGNFEIPYLLPGMYRVTVTSAGFKAAVRDQIELRVGDRMALDFALDVGNVGESVTVTGETPLLDTTSASVSAVMNQQLLVDLPGVGGNPFYYTRLVSGVINSGNWGGGGSQALTESTQIVVNGTTNMSEASVDGSPNMAQRNVVFTPPRDLVQELKINTSAYDASLGHAAGAVTNVSTKSGTNDLHGTAYDQEAQWTATPWFTNYYLYNPLTGPLTDEKKKLTESGKLRRITGGTVSGPVIIPKLYDGRNKTFWSFGYERTNNWNEPGATYTVPSAAERQGDLSELLAAGSAYQIYDPLTTVPAAQKGRFQRQPIPGNIIPKSRLDPVAQKMLSYYPVPNQPGTIDGRQNYFVVCRNWEFINRNVMNRLDHVISDKHRLFARWNNAQFGQQSKTLDTSVTQTLVDRTGWGGVLDDVYVFSPQLLLNVRY